MSAYQQIRRFCNHVRCDSVEFRAFGDTVIVCVRRGAAVAELLCVLPDESAWDYAAARCKEMLEVEESKLKEKACTA